MVPAKYSASPTAKPLNLPSVNIVSYAVEVRQRFSAGSLLRILCMVLVFTSLSVDVKPPPSVVTDRLQRIGCSCTSFGL